MSNQFNTVAEKTWVDDLPLSIQDRMRQALERMRETLRENDEYLKSGVMSVAEIKERENVTECVKCERPSSRDVITLPQAPDGAVYKVLWITSVPLSGQIGLHGAMAAEVGPIEKDKDPEKTWEAVFQVSPTQGLETCKMLAKNAMLRRKAMRDYERKAAG